MIPSKIGAGLSFCLRACPDGTIETALGQKIKRASEPLNNVVEGADARGACLSFCTYFAFTLRTPVQKFRQADKIADRPIAAEQLA